MMHKNWTILGLAVFLAMREIKAREYFQAALTIILAASGIAA